MDRPRTLIRLDESSQALSLLKRLGKIGGVGERMIASDGEHCDVILSEYPRHPGDVTKVLDTVGAWLAETGHPDVTVEFTWPVRRPPTAAPAENPVLVWKLEDGPADAPAAGDPDDVGPAWLVTRDKHGNPIHEPVSDGTWITRQEAMALAAAMGYTLDLDD